MTRFILSFLIILSSFSNLYTASENKSAFILSNYDYNKDKDIVNQ